jgi:hypothetical protein
MDSLVPSHVASTVAHTRCRMRVIRTLVALLIVSWQPHFVDTHTDLDEGYSRQPPAVEAIIEPANGNAVGRVPPSSASVAAPSSKLGSPSTASQEEAQEQVHVTTNRRAPARGFQAAAAAEGLLPKRRLDPSSASIQVLDVAAKEVTEERISAPSSSSGGGGGGGGAVDGANRPFPKTKLKGEGGICKVAQCPPCNCGPGTSRYLPKCKPAEYDYKSIPLWYVCTSPRGHLLH